MIDEERKALVSRLRDDELITIKNRDRRLGMAAWLAENDGIPFEVQHLFDLSEYEAQAAEIEEMTYGTGQLV